MDKQSIIYKLHTTLQIKTIIQKNDLIPIIIAQYNDVFSKILTTTELQFFSILNEQILLHLQIINKIPINNINTFIKETIYERYLQDKELVNEGFRTLNETSLNNIEYLDRLCCFIHCPGCSEPLHTCGRRFFLFGDYVFCLYCQKVYNEFQVKMYCDFCKIDYYTTLREIKDSNMEYYLPVSFVNYHCQIENEEKLKCLQCDLDLFCDIRENNSNNKRFIPIKKEKNIEKIYCLNCETIYYTNNLKYNCKICNKLFKDKIQIFKNFSKYHQILLCIIHALYNKNFSFPYTTQNKKCCCDLNFVKNYKHEDNGNLIEGIFPGNEVIICDKCYSIFNYNYFKWCCPKCGEYFQTQNNTIFSVRHQNNKAIYLTNRYSLIEDSRYSKSPTHTKKNNNNLYPNNGVYEIINSNNLSPINKDNIRMLKTSSFIENNKNINLNKNNERNSLKNNEFNQNITKYNEKNIPRNINIKISNYYSCINSNDKNNSKNKNETCITNTEVEKTSKILDRRKASPSPKMLSNSIETRVKYVNIDTINKIKTISENMDLLKKKNDTKKNNKKFKKYEKYIKKKN